MTTEPTANETTARQAPEHNIAPDIAAIPISEAGRALRAQLDQQQASKAKPVAPGKGIWAVDHPVTEAGEKLAREMAAWVEPGGSPRGPDAKPFGVQPKPTPPTAKSPDGEVVNLEDGTVTKGEPTADESEPLIVDEAILPRELIPEAQQFAVDIEAIAAAHNLPRDGAQAILSAATSLHMLDRDQLGDTFTPDKAIQVMANRYGEKFGDIIKDAQAAATALGDGFKQWCDDTGAGNSPATLMILHLMKLGDFDLTPAQAAAKIKEIRSSKDGGSAYSIARTSVLSRIAHPSQREVQAPQSSPFPTREPGNPTSTLAPMTARKSLSQRLAEINADPDLMSADAVKRKKLVAERAQIMTQLYGRK